MSKVFDSIKSKLHKSGQHKSGQHKSGHDKPESEQQFTTQPHPAKSNDPSDLNAPVGGGLNSNHEANIYHARDPHVPSPQIANNLEEPLSREQLHARQAELNRD